jgi:hypothetical protein
VDESILVAYARAMRSAQRLEGRLKTLFSLHNVILRVSKTQGPLTDEEFETAMIAPNKPLGKVLDGVFAKLAEIGSLPFPDDARKGLWESIQTRNFIAHHYFGEYRMLAEDKNASPYLLLNWTGSPSCSNSGAQRWRGGPMTSSVRWDNGRRLEGRARGVQGTPAGSET